MLSFVSQQTVTHPMLDIHDGTTLVWLLLVLDGTKLSDSRSWTKGVIDMLVSVLCLLESTIEYDLQMFTMSLART